MFSPRSTLLCLVPRKPEKGYMCMVKYLKCSFAQDIKTMEEIAIGPVTDEEHSIWKYTYSDGFIQNRRLVKEVFVRNHKENNSWWQFDLEEERKSRTKLISWWVCHLQGSQDAFSKSPFSIWRADLQGKYLLYAQDEKIHVLKFQFCCSIFINPRDFKKKPKKQTSILPCQGILGPLFPIFLLSYLCFI